MNWSLLWQVPLVLLSLYLLLLITTILVVLVTTRSRHKRRFDYPTTELAPIEHDSGTVKLYMTGRDLYGDMLAKIEDAQETIYFETHSWLDDEIGRTFQQALIERARAGVEVFVIYDWLGTRVRAGHKLSFPELPHLHVIPFFALKRVLHLFHIPRWSITHRKILVVDEAVGYVGGYNIGERYQQWRDTHARVEGDGVFGLVVAFAELWNNYRNSDQARIAYPRPHWKSSMRVFYNTPYGSDYPIRSLYLAAITQAQDSIRLTNAYFLPDRHVQRALLDAAARGVDVAIVFPWRSDQAVIDWAARYAFKRYVAAGIRLYGFQHMMVHAKTLVVDGEYVLLGSANLDRLSLHVNHEVDIEMWLPDIAQQLEAVFACDMENSELIEREEWENRPMQMRIGEWILAGLWPIL